MTATAKLDFDALVLRMKEAGAFDPYPTPLGRTAAVSISKNFRNPSFAGEPSYGNGPAKIEHFPIPADLIQAQHQSMRDAIRHYLPNDVMQAWMGQFFEGDFLGSSYYRHLLSNLGLSIPEAAQNPDNSLTMQLDCPERQRTDRRIFTAEEINITQEVCQKVPLITISVLAYQAASLSYLHQLLEATEESPELSGEQKKRAATGLLFLLDGWTNNNMVDNFLPAIALHYKKNHANIGDPPTERDFTEGIDFIIRNGAFGRKVTAPAGNDLVFTCPAGKVLTDMLKFDLGAVATVNGEKHTGKAGALLAQISQLVEERLHEQPLTAERVFSEARKVTTAAAPEKF